MGRGARGGALGHVDVGRSGGRGDPGGFLARRGGPDDRAEAPVKDLITFARGGTLVESQRLYLKDTPWGSLLRTPGHGEWRRTCERTFAVTLLVIYQGAPDHPTIAGEVFAVEKVRMRLNLAPNSNQLAGTVFGEIRDTTGAIIFAGPGTYKATRIGVEPLP